MNKHAISNTTKIKRAIQTKYTNPLGEIAIIFGSVPEPYVLDSPVLYTL